MVNLFGVLWNEINGNAAKRREEEARVMARANFALTHANPLNLDYFENREKIKLQARLEIQPLDFEEKQQAAQKAERIRTAERQAEQIRLAEQHRKHELWDRKQQAEQRGAHVRYNPRLFVDDGTLIRERSASEIHKEKIAYVLDHGGNNASVYRKLYNSGDDRFLQFFSRECCEFEGMRTRDAALVDKANNARVNGAGRK